MLRDATFGSRAIILAGIAAVAAASVGLWHTDLLVTRGFGTALEGARPTLSFQSAAGGTQVRTGVAGDEGYWLTRAEVESPTPFARPLALGDHITISGRDGNARQLEIVDLKAIGTVPVKVGAAAVVQPRLLVVTCREVGAAGGQGTVRFIVEAETEGPIGRSAAKTL